MSETTTAETTTYPSLITTANVVVAVIFPLLSLIALYFRYRARKTNRQAFHADDYWAVIAWILAFALSVNIWVFGGIMGIDYLKVDITKGVPDALLCIIIGASTIQLPLSAVKISILFFYKRIFPTPKFKIAVWIAIGLISIWGAVFFILVWIQTDPVSGSWTGHGTLRFNSNALGLAQVGTSVALDFIVLCFPIPMLSSLQMPTQRKVAVGLIFWLGIFCCIAAIVRLVLLDETVKAVINSAGFSAVFNQTKQVNFMIIEPQCSIIAACLPCYGPFFAGGRAVESLIRSVRSVFSLASRDSRSGSLRSNDHGIVEDARNGSDSDSHIGLKEGLSGWRQATHHVELSTTSSRTDREMKNYQTQGINVTKAVDISHA